MKNSWKNHEKRIEILFWAYYNTEYKTGYLSDEVYNNYNNKNVATMFMDEIITAGESFETNFVASCYIGNTNNIELVEIDKCEVLGYRNSKDRRMESIEVKTYNVPEKETTISVGVATVGINGNTPQEIIEYSDKCLYKAKESGRNQVVSEI